MAQKKRSRKKTKKEIQQQEKLTILLVGLLFVLLAVFGLFQLGFLGTLLANCLRLIGGNTYPL
ncbi:hypothetical protein, partial [Enterococcus asini]